MKKLIEFLVGGISPDPESVAVEVNEADETINVNVKVSQENIGRIIGKEGKTINAIRSLAKILAIKQRKKLSLNLLS